MSGFRLRQIIAATVADRDLFHYLYIHGAFQRLLRSFRRGRLAADFLRFVPEQAVVDSAGNIGHCRVAGNLSGS